MIGAAAFFGALTVYLAKAAIDTPSGWVGFSAFLTGVATFILACFAADASD